MQSLNQCSIDFNVSIRVEKTSVLHTELESEVSIGFVFAELAVCGETKHRKMSCTDVLNGSLITS